MSAEWLCVAACRGDLEQSWLGEGVCLVTLALWGDAGCVTDSLSASCDKNAWVYTRFTVTPTVLFLAMLLIVEFEQC